MRARLSLAGFTGMMLAMLLSWSASHAQAQKETMVSVISAPFGTGSYVVTAALEDIFRKHNPKVKISHAESPGFVFNIKKLAKEPELKKSMIVGSGLAVDWMAQNGLKPFDEKYPALKLLANYNFGSMWLAALDPKIKTGKDLIGKKIGLGRATQINWAIEPDWLINYGWGIRDKVKIQFVGTSQATTALLDGLVDAAIVGGYFDPASQKLTLSPQTVELAASGRTIHHIPWGQEAVKKTIAKGMPILPITVPGGTLEGVNEPFEVFADNFAWCVDPSFPEDIAYEVVKTLIVHCAAFGDYGDIGKLITPPSLAYGWPENQIHPGALKAYKEAGLIK